MRHYLGISNKGPSVFRNVYKDDTGEPLLYLDKDAVKKLQINFAQWLEGSETISSATVTAQGVTCSISTTSPNVTLTLSASTTYGTVTLIVTSSTGEVFRGIIRIRQTVRYGDQTSVMSDYA